MKTEYLQILIGLILLAIHFYLDEQNPFEILIALFGIITLGLGLIKLFKRFF